MPKKSKNPYDLSSKLDNKHKSLAVSVDIEYFVPEDEIHAHVSLRKDVTDPALQLRLFRAVEQAMRSISSEYEMDFVMLEGVAKQFLIDGETNGSGYIEDDSKHSRGCRCK